MGVRKSITAGNAKIDVNVDFPAKLPDLVSHPFRNFSSGGSPFSLAIGSLCIKHPNLFGSSEKLDFWWIKGLCDSNISISYRKPRAEWLSQRSFFIQHSLSPEIAVHGIPFADFSSSSSGGVNLSRFSAGLDLFEPATSSWSSKTCIKFEHVRTLSDDGHSINKDLHGFPVTSSRGYHDSMVILKQESQFAKANNRSFTRINLQIEQGVPFISKWLVFNRFKFAVSRGVKLGPAFFCTSLSGGSVVGDIAPYQAFAVGGPGSVRGYGEGAIGSGRSCFVANNELTLPLDKRLEGFVFLDCGSDLGTGRHVPWDPGLRHRKPGSGVGFGYGIRFKSQLGNLQIGCAVNALRHKTYQFGFTDD